MKYLKLLRVHHYVKNLLIVLPLFFSGTLLSDTGKIINCILAFICFCLLSSAIYIFNDIRDIEQDRNHPRKSQRPIASGAVSVKAGILFIIFLIIVSGTVNLVFLSRQSVFGSIYLAAYLIINIFYSLYLKHIPIIDVSCVAAGFLIRLMYGAFVTNITISNWLYLTVIVTSFYMALGKRRNELVNKGERFARKVLNKYTVGFLDKGTTIMLALTITCYALWCLDSTTIAHYGTDRLVWTVPLVIMITLKYNLDIEINNDGDPVEILTHDKALITLVAIYICLMTALLYCFN